MGNVGIKTRTPQANLDAANGTVKIFKTGDAKTFDGSANMIYPMTHSGTDWAYAYTDGFVVASIKQHSSTIGLSNGCIFGYTTSDYKSLTNEQLHMGAAADYSTRSGSPPCPILTGNSFTMPVRKGEYWKVIDDTRFVGTLCDVELYWIPLGDQTGEGQ